MTETPASLLELAKILQLASVEWMAASVPDARIIEITPCLAERWRVTREEIIGQTLAKYGKGKLSARHVTDETNDAGQNAPTRVEVTYSPPAGAPKHARFSAQLMKADGKEVMLLIGQSSRAALAAETRDVERRLQLALRSGGYALWDYDYSTGVSNLSPEVYEMLSFPVGDSSLNFKTWNERVHPDDVNKTIDHSLAHSGNNVDQWQTKYRVRTRDEKYIWVEVIAGVVRDPIDGKPTKTIGLARNISEQMNAFERLRFSERNLRRSQAAARLGSWAYKVDTGIVKLSEEMMELFGIADTVLPPSLTLLESYMDAEDQEKWREALELAKIGRNVPNLEFM
ncbi:MAG TPA: PAS domain-containing protein, partial [Aestuariivirgaceae bacterium]